MTNLSGHDLMKFGQASFFSADANIGRKGKRKIENKWVNEIIAITEDEEKF